jgi:LysM repeat protein
VRRTTAIIPFLVIAAAVPVSGQSLKGSPASLTRQNRVAHEHEFSYLDTSRDVREFVDKGLLVRLRSTEYVRLHGDVSFPYARAEVKLFAERLGRQYKEACGERLVVTSLTRPWSRQPANASDRSVHPTGMALDLRKSERRSCQRWLEETLLALEDEGVLEATRERRPPHYHVAVFPSEYRRHVAAVTQDEPAPKLAKGSISRASILPMASNAGKKTNTAKSTVAYKVHRGDTLWEIARKHATTVEAVKQANNLRNGRIMPGQVITIPAAD